MAFTLTFVSRDRRHRTTRIDVPEDDQVRQFRMVLLHAQHVVRPLLTDGARDLGLRAHRVDGDDTALDVEHLEQFGDRRNLVGLLRCHRLVQHHAHAGRKRADHMQRLSGRLARDKRSVTRFFQKVFFYMS